MEYLKHTYRAPAPVEDDVVAALWAAGTLGVEAIAEDDGGVRLEAYFPEGELGAIELPPRVVLVGEEVVGEEDWLAPFRERARPFSLGARFVVDPREPAPGAAADERTEGGRWLLRLPARRAFGIGSHESTRLALELLEEVAAERGRGLRVVDLGTGTGILAFAALRLGARSAVAFDVDPVAAFHARDNARLNGLDGRGFQLFAGRSDGLVRRPPRGEFDLALVNVIPEEVLGDLPAVVDLLAPEGELVLSGLLVERSGELLAQLVPLGLEERSRREAGEWAALRLKRGGAGT
jgi:ribosomal protein L11 methyltransferase